MTITGTDILLFFSEQVFPRFRSLVETPVNHGEILWTILPLLISTFMIEVYFGRHKTEELGWNSAFANCISLLWVTTALLRFMYEEYGRWVLLTWDPTGHTPTVVLIYILGVWAFLLAIFNYYHVLPKGVSFFVSSAIPVNITALIVVIIVIGKIRVDAVTITASFILFVLGAIVLSIIEAMIKPSPEAKEYIEEYKEHALELQEERERAFQGRVQRLKNRCVAQWHATKMTFKRYFGMHKRRQQEEQE